MRGTLRPIFYVEDSDEDFVSVTHALRQAGACNRVQRYADGLAAKSAFSASGDVALKSASLILLDLNLPGLHGCELLSLLRSRADLPAIPVIILSTSSYPRDIDRCYAAGANAYLVKPLGLEELERMMASVVDFWLRLAQLPNSA